MIDRRAFLRSAGVLGLANTLPALGAEPPPETTRIRLTQTGGICFAPIFVAEQLMRAEGFSDVQYVHTSGGGETTSMLAKGAIDITIRYVASNILDVDAGLPVVMFRITWPTFFARH